MSTVIERETPQQAARRLSAGAIRDGFQPQALHCYTDGSGTPLFWRIRLKNPDTGGKFIRPMHVEDGEFVMVEPAFDDGKPLYRLHDLAGNPDAPVIVTEGENKADALAKRGITATTSGAAGSAGSADWKPLTGRAVTIWPDNDEPGQRYASDVAERLLALGCTVRVIDVASLGLSPKDDAVDWLMAHPDATAGDVWALPVVEAEGEPPGADWPDPEPLPDARLPAQAFDLAPIPEALMNGTRPRDRSPAHPPGDRGDLGDSQALAPKTDGRHAGDSGIQTRTEDGKPRAQAAVLIDIGRMHDLFHDVGGDAYAKVKTGARTAVMTVGGTEYRETLGREYFTLTGRGANRNAVSDATNTLAAIAKYDGAEEAVSLRVASTPSGIEIDIGDATGDAVIVTGSGWRIAAPTVNFRRSGKPMPLPRPGVADFSLIWNYVNVATEDRPLVAAWLLAALRPSGPYPIALLIGEQGTGKSSASRTLKSLTDPSAVMLRPPPREDRDLLVAAVSSWTVALDNLSGMNPQLSDCLCRLSTGGGFAGRKLYTDADETLIEVQRPVIANGIDDIATRPDLADRCLHLLLPPLTSRKTEGAIQKRFQADAPAIFAALLDGLVLAVKEHATVHLGTLPRMADFATWAAAGLPALGFTTEEFLSAYTRNRGHMAEMAVESSPVASALVSFMSARDTWTGASADLLDRLADTNPGAVAGQAWPKSAKGLVGALRRLAPALRGAGITTSMQKTETRNVLVVCRVRKEVPDVPDVPAAPFKAGTSGAYVPADDPDAPAETRVPGTSGASGALKPTLHAADSHLSDGQGARASGEGDAAAPRPHRVSRAIGSSVEVGLASWFTVRPTPPPSRPCTAAEYAKARGEL